MNQAQLKMRLELIFFIWVLRPVKIIINHKVGRKREIPEKNHLITRKQDLACLTHDPS